MTKIMEEEKQKPGLFQWIIVIVVPLAFALTLALIILTFMGVDVVGSAKEMANKVPGLSSIVTTDEELDIEREVDKWSTELSEKETTISQLTSELQEQDNVIDDLNNQIAILEKTLEEKELNQEEQDKVWEDMSSSFKGMDAEASAPILVSLEDSLAVGILKSLPNQERGNILSQMSPEDAARLTNLLLIDDSN